MFIKTFFLVATITVATAQSWSGVIDECAAQYDLSEDLSSSEVEKIEGCIGACAMKRLGTMNEYGYWTAEEILEQMPKDWPEYEPTAAAFRRCADKKGETDCETASILRKCLLEELPCKDNYECAVNSYLFLLFTPEMIQNPNSA